MKELSCKKIIFDFTSLFTFFVVNLFLKLYQACT